MADKLDFIQCTQSAYDNSVKEAGYFYRTTDTNKLYLGEILINPKDYARKDEIPTKTSQLENNSGYIRNTVNDLTYYYNKDNTYNRTEIDERISAIPKFERKVVDVLPETGLPEVLYLLRIEQPDEENSNLFEEWIWENGKWERLGYQTINLVDYALKTDVETTIQSTLQAVYPVGAIYISTISTNPAAIFNFGSWELIEDRFLLGASSTQAAGTTGGSKTTTLTKTNLPNNRWDFTFHGTSSNNGGGIVAAIGGDGSLTGTPHPNSKYRDGGNVGDAASAFITLSYDNGGKSESFSNMPPYLTVYIWKRIA